MAWICENEAFYGRDQYFQLDFETELWHSKKQFAAGLSQLRRTAICLPPCCCLQCLDLVVLH